MAIRSTLRRLFGFGGGSPANPQRRDLLRGLLTGGVVAAATAQTAHATGGDWIPPKNSYGNSMVNLGKALLTASGYGHLEVASPLTGRVRRLLVRSENTNDCVMFVSVSINGVSVNGVEHPTEDEVAFADDVPPYRAVRTFQEGEDSLGHRLGWMVTPEEGKRAAAAREAFTGRQNFPTAPIELLQEIIIDRPIYKGEIIRVSLYNADAGSGHLVSGVAEVQQICLSGWVRKPG